MDLEVTSVTLDSAGQSTSHNRSLHIEHQLGSDSVWSSTINAIGPTGLQTQRSVHLRGDSVWVADQRGSTLRRSMRVSHSRSNALAGFTIPDQITALRGASTRASLSASTRSRAGEPHEGIVFRSSGAAERLQSLERSIGREQTLDASRSRFSRTLGSSHVLVEIDNSSGAPLIASSVSSNGDSVHVTREYYVAGDGTRLLSSSSALEVHSSGPIVSRTTTVRIHNLSIQ